MCTGVTVLHFRRSQPKNFDDVPLVLFCWAQMIDIIIYNRRYSFIRKIWFVPNWLCCECAENETEIERRRTKKNWKNKTSLNAFYEYWITVCSVYTSTVSLRRYIGCVLFQQQTRKAKTKTETYSHDQHTKKMWWNKREEEEEEDEELKKYILWTNVKKVLEAKIISYCCERLLLLLMCTRIRTTMAAATAAVTAIPIHTGHWDSETNVFSIIICCYLCVNVCRVPCALCVCMCRLDSGFAIFQLVTCYRHTTISMSDF